MTDKKAVTESGGTATNSNIRSYDGMKAKIMIGLLLVAGFLLRSFAAEPSACPKTVKLLSEGKEPVRIVCFGDSITAVHYHTGGMRAWCDMVGIGLQRLYPGAKLEMINAGISGNTSAQGLERIRTVLDKKPTLVVVAFGMNDLRGRGQKQMTTEQSRTNQEQIIKLCRETGAEVALCTVNSVYPGDDQWPCERMAPYADLIHQIGEAEKAPVADVYRAFEAIRAKNPTEWMLLMSEWIHPNMNGHRIIAQEVIRAITGQSIALDDVPAFTPGIPFTLAKLAKGQPVTVLAMEPADTIIAEALKSLYPAAMVTVIPWLAQDRPLEQIMKSAGGIRKQMPDLVVVAVSAATTDKNEEWYVRNYSDLYNSTFSFDKRNFDCVGILPAVFTPKLDASELRRQELARAIIKAHDIDPVERKNGDESTPAQLLAKWLSRQVPATNSAGTHPGGQ